MTWGLPTLLPTWAIKLLYGLLMPLSALITNRHARTPHARPL